MKKLYKIGEFAKNLGVSVGFLKHHERYGLITPQVAESGYRYYRMGDGMQVLHCLKLQGMGFTSKEISTILRHSDSQILPDLLHHRSEALKKKIALEQETLAYIERLEKLSAALPTQNGEMFTIETGEPFYILPNVQENDFIVTEELRQATACMNALMPLVEPCAIIGDVALSKDIVTASSYDMGLYIPKNIADKLGLQQQACIRMVDPGRCFIFRYQGMRQRSMNSRENSLKRMLHRPLSLCQQHGFTPKGEVYVLKTFYSLSQDQNQLFETVLIPIE